MLYSLQRFPNTFSYKFLLSEMPQPKPYERPADFIDPGKPSKCKWHLGTAEKSPHIHRGIAHRQQITPNILEVIGCTPLVKLNNIPASDGIECEMCKSIA